MVELGFEFRPPDLTSSSLNHLTGHQNWPGLAQLYVIEAGDLKLFSRQNCWAKNSTVRLKRNQSTQVNYTKAGGESLACQGPLGLSHILPASPRLPATAAACVHRPLLRTAPHLKRLNRVWTRLLRIQTIAAGVIPSQPETRADG